MAAVMAAPLATTAQQPAPVQHELFTTPAVVSTSATPVHTGTGTLAVAHTLSYPAIEFGSGFAFTGAALIATRPYGFAKADAGSGVHASLLASNVSHLNANEHGALLVRAGAMPTAFGAYAAHALDAEEPLADAPIGYGYEGAPLSLFPVTGVQVNAAQARWDARLQVANSSGTAPRGLFAAAQAANVAGGAGIRFGEDLHVGASGMTGSTAAGELGAAGLEAAWNHPRTAVRSELQCFLGGAAHAWTGYAEMRQQVNDRWFVAGRYGALAGSNGGAQSLEAAAGFRTSHSQVVKAGYRTQFAATGTQAAGSALTLQLTTVLHGPGGQ